MAPFFADIEASPRGLVETTFSISGFTLEPAAFNRRGNIREITPLATRRSRFPGKNALSETKWLTVGGAERAHAIGACRTRRGRRAGHDRLSPVWRWCGRRGWRGRRRRRGSIDHAGKAAEARLCDLPQHEVVGSAPGVAPALARVLLAGETQRALLVLVIDVPYPGDHGVAVDDLRRKIAA